MINIFANMWRRAYFLLALVRLYFALLPSYLHPDEHFQGPEVIAGYIFSYPTTKTWEFTSAAPIRSMFPLWPVYGLPMLLIKWVFEGLGNSPVSPVMTFHTLRIFMFLLSFVLEDWALHELIDVPQQRRLAIMLVASSYVTWTWQVHTFSNAVETLIVLWTLVLMKRVKKVKTLRSGALASAVLAILLVLGTFNRITFPAFVAGPGLQLLRAVYRQPSVWATIMVVGALTTLLAVTVDTVFYSSAELTFIDLLRHPIITPLNNLLYNTQSSNLGLHGTHPFYHHFIVNLPQLLGPALPLTLVSLRSSSTLLAAVSAVIVLSCFSHQEARFLLPTVPLFLTSVRLPQRFARIWVGVWIVFNILLGLLMGIYHQGGVINAQIYIGGQANIVEALWWKTYSPPTWLLDGRGADINTVDLMGLQKSLLEETICVEPTIGEGRVLVAPYSAEYLDRFSTRGGKEDTPRLRLQELWRTRSHISLDDLDFGDDGVVPTLQRVVGRRGLAIWRIECTTEATRSTPEVNAAMYRDW